jgi:hypothetical protein
MSFLFPTAPAAPPPPPTPPTFANAGVSVAGAAQRAAAAEAGGKVNGFGGTVDTSSKGAAAPATASKTLLGG